MPRHKLGASLIMDDGDQYFENKNYVQNFHNAT
jgi:hypothetical protein